MARNKFYRVIKHNKNQLQPDELSSARKEIVGREAAVPFDGMRKTQRVYHRAMWILLLVVVCVLFVYIWASEVGG